MKMSRKVLSSEFRIEGERIANMDDRVASLYFAKRPRCEYLAGCKTGKFGVQFSAVCYFLYQKLCAAQVQHG